MQRVVMGIMDTPQQADAVAQRLRAAGFDAEDISMLFADKRGTHDFAFERHTKAPEGAIIGAVFGAVLGGMAGIAAGVGVLAFPGIGALVAAGPLLAALATAAIFALLFGALGAWIGAGVPEIEAVHFDGKTTLGSILVAVHVDRPRDAAAARRVLDAFAATDVTQTTEAAVPLHARPSQV